MSVWHPTERVVTLVFAWIYDENLWNHFVCHNTRAMRACCSNLWNRHPKGKKQRLHQWQLGASWFETTTSNKRVACGLIVNDVSTFGHHDVCLFYMMIAFQLHVWKLAINCRRCTLDVLVGGQQHLVTKQITMAGENRPPESLPDFFKTLWIVSRFISFYEHSMNTSCVGLHVLYDLFDGNCGPKEPYKSLSNKLPKPSGCKSLHSATGSMAVVILKFTLSMAYHGLSWLGTAVPVAPSLASDFVSPPGNSRQ